jgi:hypothetical protein
LSEVRLLLAVALPKGKEILRLQIQESDETLAG